MLNCFNEPFEVIDLGVYLDAADYSPWTYRAQHVNHADGAKAMANRFNRQEFSKTGKKVANTDFPESLGLAWTHLWVTDRAGNHIDAPYHFGSEVEGKPAKTIDRVPLSWCIGPGVRLDFRSHVGRDIMKADLERELDRLNVTLEAGMIPPIWSGAYQHIEDDDRYWQSQAGLSLEGLHFLLDRGVRLVGIDGYAMDVSYQTMQQQFQDDNPMFYPAHFAGRQREHMHLEKLANLDALPRATDFLFAAFPVKIRGGSAGWVRPVAIVPQSHFEGAKTAVPSPSIA
ncbi:cyclase family protein [Synechococcus sp. PCC 7336]|uniref:cyclase family protein n=1 Tax=Synechococcus sp. PCC 7336 TaxID=195250 RepID=UPI0003472DB7|nr:cyclase family protein [Synechococcus sp. PCC 7336]